MKSKITLIILIIFIVGLSISTVFFGCKYFEQKGDIQSLNAEIQELKENYESEVETTSEIVEKEVIKYTIAKFDSSKIDYTQREDVYVSSEDCGEYLEKTSGLRYRVGSSKNISTFSVNGETTSQIIYNEKEYKVSDNNIVDLKTQYHGNATDWYVIVLLDNGTIKYAKNVYDNVTNTSSFSEFKEYTLDDVTGLVNLQMNTVSGKYIQCVGAITSDGVTHILPYDMP